MAMQLYPLASEVLIETRKFRLTGEYRQPKSGEYYLGDGSPEVHLAHRDLTARFNIAAPVEYDLTNFLKGVDQYKKPLFMMAYKLLDDQPKCACEFYQGRKQFSLDMLTNILDELASHGVINCEHVAKAKRNKKDELVLVRSHKMYSRK